jgi:hypothetical protein
MDYLILANNIINFFKIIHLGIMNKI